MTGFARRVSVKAGLPPGSLIHVGDRKADEVRVSVIEYDEQNFKERECKDLNEAFPGKESSGFIWINIDGLHDENVMKRVGDEFDLHPLVLEDAMNTGQRPKMDDYETYLYVTLRMLSCSTASEDGINAEQFSLVIGPGYLVTFQERQGDVFDAVRERLRAGKGRIRKSGPDYLAYALIDAIVDNYFIILEKMGERIENLEDILLDNPSPETLEDVHHLKRQLIFLRKSIWPLREVLGSLQRDDSGLIQERTLVYLKDVYDHTIQIMDTIETFRDMAAGMLDVYLSSLSNRMNEVIKVLTVIATIFMPLTLISGIYGMNFKYMPELAWRWGYTAVLALMAFIAAIMLAWFRRKRFL